MKIEGIIPALITPMHNNGQVNASALRCLVNFLVEKGADGIFICGTSAEFFLLEDNERREIVEVVTQEVNGRLPVIAHIGAIRTERSITLARHAKACGVDAISSVPPYYFSFGMKDIVRYYQNISDTVDLPMILYHIPVFTGVHLRAGDIVLIAGNCNICGVKYSDYNYAEVEQIMRVRPDLKIYNGHEEVMISALPLGIAGSIGSTFNVLVSRFKHIEALFKKGDIGHALQQQKEANAIIDVMLSTAALPAIKYLLTCLGIPCGSCGKPFPELSERDKKALDALIPKLEGEESSCQNE